MNSEFSVLIAEDDPSSRMLLAKALKKVGYDVTTVENGRMALEAFSQGFYPIVLTDWMMPELDGIGLCRALRERRMERYVFVILLTGKTSHEDIVSGFEAGVDDYLTKPVNLNELIARLNTAKRILELEISRKAAEEKIRKYSRDLEAMVQERTLQLKNSEERYRTILESIEDGYYEVDLSGRITFFNDATCTITGYGKEDLLGMDATLLTDKESGKTIYKEYQKVLNTGCPVKQVEWVIRNKSGIVRYLDNSVSLIRDSAGRPCGYRGIVRDVTDRKEMENELVEKRRQAEAANRAKSEFFANLSHEIRTPLNGIIGISELAMETCGDENQRKFLKTIESEGNSLYGLINNILDFSKIEAKRMELERVAFNLGHMLEDLSTTTNMRATHKGLKYRYSISPDVPHNLLGDPGRLRQILTNLLVNALKFTHKGSIELSADLLKEENDQVKLRFSVKDTGIGIPLDKQPQIFDPFTQADGSTTRKYGGTGLGTTISKQLAELMGGEIGLESELGKGSTFWFSVVMSKDSEPKSVGEEQESDLKNLNVLMVHAQKTKFLPLTTHLSSLGCRVKMVSNGSRALTALKKAAAINDPFEVIVTGDIASELDGFELSGKIRMMKSCETVPIIYVTATGQRGDADHCKMIGIDGYLSGPTEPESLYKAIRIILSQYKENKVVGPRNLVTRYTLIESEVSKKMFQILLVEDYPTNQQLAMRHLRNAGYAVDLAENGQLAVEAFEKKHYDLILMDMQMPVMDGYKAAKAIRAMEERFRDGPESIGRLPRIPIIATTAHAMDGDRELCLDAGMDDYLTKPVKKVNLLSMVQKWLSKTSGQDQPALDYSEDVAIQTPVIEKTGQPIDFKKAIDEFEGDEEFLLGVLKEFLGNAKQQVQRIYKAVADGKAEVVKKEAHSIKGAAADLAAQRLSELAFEIEKMGKCSTLEAGDAATGALEAELARLEEFASACYPMVFNSPIAS